MALIDKASLLMVPSTYEDGTLYNVLPSGNKAPDETGNHNGYDQTRADFTFSRGSNLAATRVNADGLIEKGRENLLTHSNTFSDSDWVKADTSVTSGQADKDGGTNAWLLAITGAGGFQTLRQTKSVSGVNTISIYAKANTLNWMRIINGVSSTYFDIANGVVGTDSSIGASIESAGNGFFRCSIPFSGAGSYVYIYPATGDGNVTQSSGSIYIQSAQLEAGLVATDYIETGATTATAGVLENTPRIDYSSGAGALLLEPQRTNVITNSEYFGAWTASGLTISSNEATSPEGVSNAAKLTLPSGSAIKRIALGSMPVTAVARSYSFFVKSDDISAVQLVHSGDVQGYARFDISSGVVGSKGSKTTSDIEDYGNGWYRCIANFDATNSFGSTIYLYINDSATGGYGGSTNAQGDLFVFGAQYEEASHVSSYVPTYGSAATRGADSCSVTGVSDVIGQTEGTLYVEYTASHEGSAGERIFAIGDGTSSNRIVLFEATNKIRVYAADGGAVQWDYVTTIDFEGTHKIAVTYAANNAAIYIDGTQLSTDTSFVVPNCGNVYLGTSEAFGVSIGGSIKEAILFDSALTQSEAEALTTL